MIIERIPVGLYAANCYVIGCENTLEGAVFDPGEDAPSILEKVKKHNLRVKYIIITHGHFDHIGALADVKEETGAQVAVHKNDKGMLINPEKSLSSLVSEGSKAVNPDILLEDGERLRVGDMELKILHTPGHSPGGICVSIDDKVLISGDTLFAGSIGRTDLPGGNFDMLIRSIKSKLMVLDEEITVYPGHGAATTIGTEKERNPFL